jgi:hypothetical protein
MANVVIDILAEFTGKKAFKQAESATAGLEKGVKRLGKQIAGVFAAQKILQFGKASIKAFAADEKASKSLEIALRNTGNAFDTMNVEGFIAKLQRTTGVLDDQLRPAFRTLLTATGDVKKSQDGLQLALDISAGTGKDLSAVSMALAKAYGGQTTALSRLGAGLDKATLKTGNMDVILGQLNDKFAGQALAAVKTYSGQIAVLNVALENAKETIGKGLLDSFAMLAGSNGLQGSVTGIQKMADFIADVIKNVAFLIKQFEALKPAIIAIGAVLLIAFAPMTAAIVAIVALLAIAGKNLKKNSFKNGIIPGGMGNVSMTGGSNQNIVKDNASIKTHTALQKIDNGVIKDKIQMTAGEKALAELKKIFDLQGIELQAALNGTITKEEEARIKGLIALNNSDGALAIQALSALNAASATNALAKAFADFGIEMDAARSKIGAQEIANSVIPNTAISNNSAIPSGLTNSNSMDAARSLAGAGEALNSYNFGNAMDAARTAAARGGTSSPTYIINATGIGDQQIASVVQGAIQDLNRFGSSTTYAGAI